MAILFNRTCINIQVRISTYINIQVRLTMHLTSGAIKEHQLVRHQSNLTRDNVVGNTKILRKHGDTIRLFIHEALLIKFRDPNLNRQDTGNTRTLQLYS